MKTVIKYIQLPFAFSPGKLVAELNALKENWILHFNKAHYEGDWSALPLRSLNGSLTNVLPENTGSGAFCDTLLMAQCPYMKSITALFPCEHNATRLLKLKPGAIIKEHTDGDLGFEHGEARIHIPITTNPQVEFYLDNERMDLQPGECWYMNFDLPHRIANLGNTDRVHLVMDIIVNEQIREMFDKTDPARKKIIPAKEKLSPAGKQQMIAQLKQMNTPTSNQLAKEMEGEFK